MNRLFLLFSHKLTEEQIKDAKNKFGIQEFIYLPQNLQYIWSNIPAEATCINDTIYPIYDFLSQNISKGDYVLIQGEFGATYKLVNHIKLCGANAIYSTTKREAIEIATKDGVIKNSIFKHCTFRHY